jgi:hypothetical protein
VLRCGNKTQQDKDKDEDKDKNRKIKNKGQPCFLFKKIENEKRLEENHR